MILSKLHNPCGGGRGLLAAAATAALIAGGAAVLCMLLRRNSCEKVPGEEEWEEVGIVSKLFIHPVKSAGPLSLKEAFASKDGLSKGLLYDRSFIVYTEDGEMVTGRQVSKLVTLKTSLEGNQLTISNREGGNISLDLSQLNQKNAEVKFFKLRCSEIQGIDCGDKIAEWLTRFLYNGSKNVRLIYKGGSEWERPRKKFEYFSFSHFKKKDCTLYNDSCSYMIMTESSMRDLNGRLETPVDFSYFRPCIVIEGSAPFDEDTWRFVKFGDEVVIHEAKPREICLLTQVDPKDGSKKTKHYDMLKSYRRVTFPKSLADRWKNNPIFGLHCGSDREGRIVVGDKVFVTRGKPYWVATDTHRV